MDWPTLYRIELTYWHLALSSQLFAQSSSLSAKKPWPPWSTGRSPPRISISSKMQPAKVCQLVCPLGRKASQPACRRGAETYGEMGTCPTKLLWTFLFQLLDFNFVLWILKFRFSKKSTRFVNVKSCSFSEYINFKYQPFWLYWSLNIKDLFWFVLSFFQLLKTLRNILFINVFMFWSVEKEYIEKWKQIFNVQALM